MFTNKNAWGMIIRIMDEIMQSKKESDLYLKLYHDMKDNYKLDDDTALIAAVVMWDMMKKAGANDEESKTDTSNR